MERLIERLGEIPEGDYTVYVEPYMGIPHLDAVRAALDPGDIKKLKEITITPRLAAFPAGLESAPGFENLYSLLKIVNSHVDGLSYAQAETQKEKRTHILKILWAFGSFGKFNNERTHLLLDHKIYHAQKIQCYYDRVSGYFETLAYLGVQCEVIPLTENNWLTPTGALRSQGIRETSPPWMMRMSMDESAGGVTVMVALQKLAIALDEEFGKTAFRRFGRAEMQIMLHRI
jgi:hypothetical protein